MKASLIEFYGRDRVIMWESILENTLYGKLFYNIDMAFLDKFKSCN